MVESKSFLGLLMSSLLSRKKLEALFCLSYRWTRFPQRTTDNEILYHPKESAESTFCTNHFYKYYKLCTFMHYDMYTSMTNCVLSSMWVTTICIFSKVQTKGLRPLVSTSLRVNHVFEPQCLLVSMGIFHVLQAPKTSSGPKSQKGNSYSHPL